MTKCSNNYNGYVEHKNRNKFLFLSSQSLLYIRQEAFLCSDGDNIQDLRIYTLMESIK